MTRRTGAVVDDEVSGHGALEVAGGMGGVKRQLAAIQCLSGLIPA
jgi:hypothetical protein